MAAKRPTGSATSMAISVIISVPVKSGMAPNAPVLPT